MSFEVSFREYKLNFDFENVRIKAIDASHGTFVRSFPRHMHGFYELHYIAGGHGRLILDDAEYELSKGKLFCSRQRCITLGGQTRAIIWRNTVFRLRRRLKSQKRREKMEVV